jgi:hypothetical protein
MNLPKYHLRALRSRLSSDAHLRVSFLFMHSVCFTVKNWWRAMSGIGRCETVTTSARMSCSSGHLETAHDPFPPVASVRNWEPAMITALKSLEGAA